MATTAVTLREMIMGFRTTQLLHVAAKLGIADLVQHEPQSADALAAATSMNAGALRRVLRALASLGLFEETDDGRWRITPLAEPLRSDAPESVRGMAILYGEDWFWRAYGELEHSVVTGEPAFDKVHGAPFFEYLNRHPEAASVFNQAMTGFSRQEATEIVAAYDFSPFRTIVDVGGGQGFLLSAILAANPAARGVLFDQASVVAGRSIERCTIEGGDFFRSAPPGGDLYLLKSIIHDWDDARAETILRNCREAMADHARLLVIERVIPLGNGPAEAKLFDINMMVNLGALERTEREYAALLEQSGLELVRTLPTASPLSVVETRKKAA